MPGWPTAAKLIAETPDFQAFPSFTDLNIKSLLYYQAELVSLRELLQEAELEDNLHGEKNGVDDASKFAENLDFLFDSRKQDRKSKQWIYIKEIRDVLKNYSKSIWNIGSEDD